jgi:hypothetical protein
MPDTNRRRHCARCGAWLASDNPATLCSPCQSTTPDPHAAPPDVPIEFWHHDTLQAAFDSRHMGKVIRAYRQHPYHGHRGLTQDVVAGWAGIAQSQVSTIEGGPPINNLDRLTTWAQLLGIPEEHLWFKLPDDPRQGPKSSVLHDVSPQAAVPGAFGVLGDIDAELLDMSHGRSGGRRSPIDASLIEAHHATEEALAGLYRAADPVVAIPPTVAYANSLLRLLDQSFGEAERMALGAVAAGVHAQVGLWACHMHQPQVAYRFLSTACDVAENTGDPHLWGRTLGAFSYLFSSAPRGGQGGQPQRALRLLGQALALVDHGDSFTKGWLATWRADQHSTLGLIAEAQRDVEAAQHWLDVAEDDRLNGFFARRAYGYGMASHLDSVRGLVHALAGRTDEATQSFERVVATSPNMRRRVGTYAHRALANAMSGEPAEASAALSKATALAKRENYGMGLARARGVRARFDSAWSSLPVVRDLDEQLRHALAQP